MGVRPSELSQEHPGQAALLQFVVNQAPMRHHRLWSVFGFLEDFGLFYFFERDLGMQQAGQS